MAQNKLPRNGWMPAVGIILFLVPLFLSITWGDQFNDSVFHALQAAQRLGDDLPYAFAGGRVAQAPLYIALLWAAGAYAPQAAMIANGLGWGATAVLVLFSLRAAGRPAAALIAAVLLVFNPLVIATSGTAFAWVLALGWAAAALAVLPTSRPTRTVWLQSLLLILLLAIQYDASTIIFALALAALAVYKGRSSWLPFALLAAVMLLWSLTAVPQLGMPPRFLFPGFRFPLLGSWPLYWLYGPFILLGLWDLWRWDSTAGEAPAHGGLAPGQELFALLLLWAAAGIVGQSSAAPVLTAAVAVTLAGLGAAWLARRLSASGRLAAGTPLLVALLAAAPLLLVSLAALGNISASRPLGQVDLQEQAASWIAANSDAQATLYAPPRVGYSAGRATIPALVTAINDDNAGAVYDQLLEQTPGYVVSEDSQAWDYITRTTWFRERYQEQAAFTNDYAPASPVTVWQYAETPFDTGQEERLEAVVDDRFALVGYRFEPRVIAPGDDVYITLYLQALEPVEQGFITSVHLTTPDGWVWAWRDAYTPRALPGEWWQPGQIIPERIRLLTTPDLPLGAYDLQVFWQPGDEKTNMPVVRDGDENVLDRVFLGHVLMPPEVNADGATPVGAQFGETIRLEGYEFAAPAPGQPWTVTLYWDASGTPPADYTVFVHLTNEAGEIVAGHDGMPANNFFPTGAWQPGLLVGDSHELMLPAGMAPGPYQLNVGMYLLQTGERLPVWDANGVEQVDRSLPLAVVEIGE